jgi:hypothetical protein
MKRTSLILSLFLVLSVFFNSCGRDKSAATGDGAVFMICDCFLEAEIENEYDLMDLEHDEKKMKEVIKCVLPILKDVRSELDDMSDEGRAEYFGDAIKASVDCECGVKLLDIAAKLYDHHEAEYAVDEIIEELEWFSEHSYYDYPYEEAYAEEYYDDYYDDYDDYEYDGDYDDGNGYELVAQMMDAVYFGNIEIGVSSEYDVANIMDTYSDGYDYISIDKYFEGYTFDVEFYFDESGDLSSISCNTFYDSGWEYEAEMDSYEVLEYLEILFGAPDSEGGDYNDWSFNDQEISFNIFEDGYSLYIDPSYDY